MAAEAKDAQQTVEREYIVEGKDYAVSADDGGFSLIRPPQTQSRAIGLA
ncbi:hypothetical protein QKW52_15405 [Bacillus sonorensis]|nr:hypothetical protein [Bacillus sonorensis]